MIQEYKDFWKQYRPYKLHPADRTEISPLPNFENLVEEVCIDKIKRQYRDLDDPKNNNRFTASINPNAIHSNMYCKSFTGNPETAKLFILSRNPSLSLSDYKDEHLNKAYREALNAQYKFKAKGLLYLDDEFENTCGSRYWNRNGRLRKIIDGVAKKKSRSPSRVQEQLQSLICLMHAIGYHSSGPPEVDPEALPSSRITKKLVHSYLLPKAKNNEVFIFCWRAASFWDLGKHVDKTDKSVMFRDKEHLRNTYFLKRPYFEAERIVDFLLPLID